MLPLINTFVNNSFEQVHKISMFYRSDIKKFYALSIIKRCKGHIYSCLYFELLCRPAAHCSVFLNQIKKDLPNTNSYQDYINNFDKI